MKLNKVLTVDGQQRLIVQDEVRLDLLTPGRATFIVRSDMPLKGLVTLDVGYNQDELQRHFIGHVERCTTGSSQEQVLFCRELTSVLAMPLPLNLRHVDLQQVLLEISARTGLRFRAADAPYARVKVPYFYSLASGFQAMDSLAQVFTIPDFIWQQQGNGEVYVGSWRDSYWGQRNPLPLPPSMFEAFHGNQSATLAALPGLRPGMPINMGDRITAVTLAGTKMSIKWKTQFIVL